MAGANATAFSGACSASSADSSSQGQVPQPSGMMIGPSMNQCYTRPLQFNTLPQGFNPTPSEGNYGYGYQSTGNPCQYMGTYGEYHMPNNTMADTASRSSASNGCFSGLATTPVNACGFDQGGVPVTIAALEKYNSPANDAQNTTCHWGQEIHSGDQAQTVQCAQWLGLEGGTRGLCLLAGLIHELPNGLCVSFQCGGGSNTPGANFFSVPDGCTVTFSHEMQEMLNPNCCGPQGQDTSDVRNNPAGTPAHCNNFKSCGVGYQCFDTALTAFFGTDYGNSPNAWEYAKTPAYAGGNLLAPGGGAPIGGTPGGGPITICQGGIKVNLPSIPQAKAATSNTDTMGKSRHKQQPPGPNSPYPYAYGGRINYASGGGVTRRAGCCCCNPAPAPKPAPAPAPAPGPGNVIKTPPICINIPNPTGPAPAAPANIMPFQSVSPAYPYRGTVCAGKISFPGSETWNFPLGAPEVPGGPGIPTPPGCGPKPAPKPGNCATNPVIPISNQPGIIGIQCVGGTFVLIGPCGPLNNPAPTGNPCAPAPGGGHGGGCGPAPGGCNPCQPCNPCNPAPAPCAPAPAPCTSPFGTVSPFMPCYMGNSPWPSPQNVFGGCLPQTPWLPGGKVDNGLGPNPAAPASPTYGPAPAQNAAFQGPNIPAPTMPFASPSTQTTTTGLCTQGFPSFCQWNSRENNQMLAHNCSMGGNCVWGLAANLQAGNVTFPTVSHTSGSPGVAPVTPGQCGNSAAYPGSDKWVGTNPNPYITQNPGTPGIPGGPCVAPCGGDGDCDHDDHSGGRGWNMGMAMGTCTQMNGGHEPGGNQPSCFFTSQGQFTGPACFGGAQWQNQGVWGGWGNPNQGQTAGTEDTGENFVGNNWCSWLQSDIAKQQGLHPGTTTTTSQGAIPCWNPPNWNNGNNPAFGNTSSPVGQGGFPSWPGQPAGTGNPSTGGYSPQATPFQNGDLYHPGFENVGGCFQGNPWQPSCLGLVNPGAISMGLAGFQLPATPTPSPTPTPTPTPGGGGTGWHGHAHGGNIGNMVDVELSPGENVHMPCGGHMTVPGQAKYGGDTEKNDTYKTKLPPGAIVVPRTASRNPEMESRFVAAVQARKSPSQALRRAHG